MSSPTRAGSAPGKHNRSRDNRPPQPTPGSPARVGTRNQETDAGGGLKRTRESSPSPLTASEPEFKKARPNTIERIIKPTVVLAEWLEQADWLAIQALSALREKCSRETLQQWMRALPGQPKSRDEDAAVCLACLLGYEDLVRPWLQAHGMGGLSNSAEGHDLLAMAIWGGQTTLLKWLIGQRLDINAVSRDDSGLLHFACERGDLEILKVLLDAGAIVETSAQLTALTPLHIACANGFLELAQELVRRGANPRAITFSRGGWTCLHTAAEYRQPDLVNWLLGLGLEVDAVSEPDDATPLLIACEVDHSKKFDPVRAQQVIAALLQAGADPYSRAASGKTPLMHAAGNRDVDVSGMLYDRENLNLEDDDGDSALSIAVVSGRADVVEKLLDCGAIVNDKVLQAAARNPDLAILKLLDKSDDDLAAKLAQLGTLAVSAVNQRRPDVLRYLQECAVLRRFKDSQLRTALEAAVRSDELDAMTLLLQAMADAEVSYTELAFMAVKSSATKILGWLLQEQRVSAGATDSKRRTLLHLACKRNHDAGLVELLLAFEADINARDASDWTPIMFAAMRNELDILELLLEKGAHTNVTTVDGQNVLDLAFKYSSDEAIDCLLERGLSPNLPGLLKVDAELSTATRDVLKVHSFGPFKKWRANRLTFAQILEALKKRKPGTPWRKTLKGELDCLSVTADCLDRLPRIVAQARLMLSERTGELTPEQDALLMAFILANWFDISEGHVRLPSFPDEAIAMAELGQLRLEQSSRAIRKHLLGEVVKNIAITGELDRDSLGQSLAADFHLTLPVAQILLQLINEAHAGLKLDPEPGLTGDTIAAIARVRGKYYRQQFEAQLREVLRGWIAEHADCAALGLAACGVPTDWNNFLLWQLGQACKALGVSVDTRANSLPWSVDWPRFELDPGSEPPRDMKAPENGVSPVGQEAVPESLRETQAALPPALELDLIEAGIKNGQALPAPGFQDHPLAWDLLSIASQVTHPWMPDFAQSNVVRAPAAWLQRLEHDLVTSGVAVDPGRISRSVGNLLGRAISPILLLCEALADRRLLAEREETATRALPLTPASTHLHANSGLNVAQIRQVLYGALAFLTGQSELKETVESSPLSEPTKRLLWQLFESELNAVQKAARAKRLAAQDLLARSLPALMLRYTTIENDFREREFRIHVVRDFGLSLPVLDLLVESIRPARQAALAMSTGQLPVPHSWHAQQAALAQQLHESMLRSIRQSLGAWSEPVDYANRVQQLPDSYRESFASGLRQAAGFGEQDAYVEQVFRQWQSVREALVGQPAQAQPAPIDAPLDFDFPGFEDVEM